MIAAAVAAAALTVSPARIALAPGRPATLLVSGPNVPVVVTAAGYGLDLRGRPRVLRAPAAWLVVSPRRMVATRAGAPVTLRARLAPGAHPGDRFALVLVTATGASRVGVAVRVRLGVVASVRAPGKVTRRIVVRSLRVRRSGRVRVFELTLANTGNVVERLRAVDVTVTIGGRRLHPRGRELLPHARALFELPWRGLAPQRLVARVQVRRLTKNMVCKPGGRQRLPHLRWLCG
jgi:hypothetical protein